MRIPPEGEWTLREKATCIFPHFTPPVMRSFAALKEMGTNGSQPLWFK